MMMDGIGLSGGLSDWWVANRIVVAWPRREDIFEFDECIGGRTNDQSCVGIWECWGLIHGMDNCGLVGPGRMLNWLGRKVLRVGVIRLIGYCDGFSLDCQRGS